MPLWLCAAGISVLILENRSLRKRPGDIPVRVLRRGKKRWTEASENPAVTSLTLVGGAMIDVAARQEHRSALVGPFDGPNNVLRPQALERRSQ
jgi:hypothetical protein